MCIANDKLDASGIRSFSELPAEDNDAYWGLFGNAYDLDLLWIVTCAALVFLMQLGFTLLEAGAVKSGNVMNVCALLHSPIQTCACS